MNLPTNYPEFGDDHQRRVVALTLAAYTYTEGKNSPSNGGASIVARAEIFEEYLKSGVEQPKPVVEPSPYPDLSAMKQKQPS